jgi:hypothetical protein
MSLTSACAPLNRFDPNARYRNPERGLFHNLSTGEKKTSLRPLCLCGERLPILSISFPKYGYVFLSASSGCGSPFECRSGVHPRPSTANKFSRGCEARPYLSSCLPECLTIFQLQSTKPSVLRPLPGSIRRKLRPPQGRHLCGAARTSWSWQFSGPRPLQGVRWLSLRR